MEMFSKLFFILSGIYLIFCTIILVTVSINVTEYMLLLLGAIVVGAVSAIIDKE
jgi:hypothetical protein